jgi:hypothetical protein
LTPGRSGCRRCGFTTSAQARPSSHTPPAQTSRRPDGETRPPGRSTTPTPDNRLRGGQPAGQGTSKRRGKRPKAWTTSRQVTEHPSSTQDNEWQIRPPQRACQSTGGHDPVVGMSGCQQ